jgi:8-oxo-dGTP pyrophosphatase MutT (NUDIX family)
MTKPYWKPNATVASVTQRNGQFLMVQERAEGRLVLNQPAGHLDKGESLLQAVARETLEETAQVVRPVALIGIYMSRYQDASQNIDATYLRFAFLCEWVDEQVGRVLDQPVERALWLGGDEIAARASEHRSILVAQTLNDYLRGQRYPLDLIYTHGNCLEP